MPLSLLPKVFVGVKEIAGMMCGITHCLQQHGFETDLYLFDKHSFSYKHPVNSNPIFNNFLTIQEKLKTARGKEKVALLINEYQKSLELLFQDLLGKYDVFIFNGWRTIFPDYSDLPLLKRNGKRVIMFFLGSEGRPQWMQGNSLELSLEGILRQTQTVFNRVRFLEQHCDYVVSHPPTSQFLTRPFVPFLGVGIPFLKPIGNVKPIRPESPLVLHAPSSPYKGTSRIRAAVETLKKEGQQFEYLELKGLPNAVVLENLARCSFVIDELYSDSLLAGLGTEAAHFGKPTLIGSLPDIRDTMQGSALPPPPCEIFHNGDPLPGMRRLLNDVEYTHTLGDQARAYVNAHWSVEHIGQRLADMARGEMFSGTLCQPENINYFRGWGLSDEEFHSMVTRYIKAFGHDALYISDKPQLLLSLLRWLKKNS